MTRASSSKSPALREFLTASRRLVRKSLVSSAFSSLTMTCRARREGVSRRGAERGKVVSEEGGRTRLIDSEIKRHDMPMLMAVSCRSPVRTQTLMPACCSV